MRDDTRMTRLTFSVFVEARDGSFGTDVNEDVTAEELALLRRCKEEHIPMEDCPGLGDLYYRITNSVVYACVLYDDIYERELD